MPGYVAHQTSPLSIQTFFLNKHIYATICLRLAVIIIIFNMERRKAYCWKTLLAHRYACYTALILLEYSRLSYVKMIIIYCFIFTCYAWNYKLCESIFVIIFNDISIYCRYSFKMVPFWNTIERTACRQHFVLKVEDLINKILIN